MVRADVFLGALWRFSPRKTRRQFQSFDKLRIVLSTAEGQVFLWRNTNSSVRSTHKIVLCKNRKRPHSFPCGLKFGRERLSSQSSTTNRADPCSHQQTARFAGTQSCATAGS